MKQEAPAGEPRRFGRFEVQRVLGRGGMGMVYQAIDPVIGRVVAIKEIRLEELRDERERKEMEERFRLEFQAAGTLSHPNIVTIYDVGKENGSTFIAMEYVEGQSMADWLRANPNASIETLLEMASQVASGLDFAHQKGIVHRDVKPANILLTQDLRPKLSDFGLVKVMSTELTTTGTVLGTPAYMSPEQITGQNIDAKTDQFSLAVILYGLLTGQQPFRAEHPSAILYKIVHEAPETPCQLNPSLPPMVDQVLMRGLAKSPQARYARCVDLVDDLRRAIFGTSSLAGTLNLRPGAGGDSRMSSSLPLGHSRVTGPPSVDHFDAGPTVLTQRTVREQRSRKAMLGTGIVLFVAAAGLVGYALSSSSSSPQPNAATVNAPAPTTPAPNPTPGPKAANPGAPTAAPTPPPAAPTPLDVAIKSQPAGAEIWIDGKNSGQKTPATLGFEPGRKISIGLELEGFETATFSFAVAELSTQQKQDGFFFPLKAKIVPGFVEFAGADYAFEVELNGRRQKLNGNRVALPPGQHEVVVVAESVFLRQTYPVDITSGAREEVRLPPAYPVIITANPANCRVSIGGRFVDVTPINDRRLVAGKHQFEFNWPALSRTKSMAVVISRGDQRIFASPD